MLHEHTSPLGLVLDERFERPVQGDDHPGAGASLRQIRLELRARGLLSQCVNLPVRPATTAELTSVHPVEYQLSLALSAPPGALAMARFAAGATIDAMNAVVDGRVRRAMVLARPPGHHASPDTARGFCFLNHVALASRLALRERGLRRVAILDWDVHQGYGTQDAFYRDPCVLTISLHRQDADPDTGMDAAQGEGAGLGTNLNLSLPTGSGNREYLHALRSQVEPRLVRFRPELILVSAGFNAYYLDERGLMRVTAEGYGAMTEWLLALADQLCDGRVVFALESGYHRIGLARSVAATLEVCLGVSRFPEAPPGRVRPLALPTCAPWRSASS